MSNELDYALHFTYKFSGKFKHIFNGSQKTFRKHAETLVILMNIQGQASDCSIPISGNTHRIFCKIGEKNCFFVPCRFPVVLLRAPAHGTPAMLETTRAHLEIPRAELARQQHTDQEMQQQYNQAAPGMDGAAQRMLSTAQSAR